MDFFKEQKVDNQEANTLWCERHRPQTLDDYIGNDHLKEKEIGRASCRERV